MMKKRKLRKWNYIFENLIWITSVSKKVSDTQLLWEEEGEMNTEIKIQKLTENNKAFSSALCWALPRQSDQALLLWHQTLSVGVTALHKSTTDSYWVRSIKERKPQR